MSIKEMEALQRLEEIKECEEEGKKRRRVEQGKELLDQVLGIPLGSKGKLKGLPKAGKKRGGG